MSYAVKAALALFRALSDPSRLRMLLLVRRLELSVGEIAAVLGQSQPRVSRHLKILADAGLLRRAKEGAWVFVRPGPALVTVAGVLDGLESAAEALADRERLAVVRAERVAAADAWFAANADSLEHERSLFTAEAEVEAAIRTALAGRAIGRLVDVGTGTGRMIELLGGSATASLGIDRNPEMLRLARGRIEACGLAQAEVRAGDMYALPGADGSADTVVLHQVLHFADDPAAAVREAARLLAPGGRLLVVDLMPHCREDLRETRRHMRLGFADEAVAGWMAAAGLDARVTARLPARDKLGVTLWLGTRTAERLAA